MSGLPAVLVLALACACSALGLISANARNRRLSEQIKAYQELLNAMHGACDTYKVANKTLSDALDNTVAALARTQQSSAICSQDKP